MKLEIPDKLLRDQDPSYESKLFFVIPWNKEITNNTDNPESIGLTEKLNSGVKLYLTAYISLIGKE